MTRNLGHRADESNQHHPPSGTHGHGHQFFLAGTASRLLEHVWMIMDNDKRSVKFNSSNFISCCGDSVANKKVIQINFKFSFSREAMQIARSGKGERENELQRQELIKKV